MNEILNETFEEEVLRILSPKIKSVLKQTSIQYRDDLEQELKLLILTKINNGFNEIKSFFDLMAEQQYSN